MDMGDVHLRVLYSFNYETKRGRKVSITEGEKLFLIRKTNTDWWQVIRNSTERPFFVPASYVEELNCYEGRNRHSDSSQVGVQTSAVVHQNSHLQEMRYSVNKNVSTPQESIYCNLPVVNERISSEKWRQWAAEELISELSCAAKLNSSDDKSYSSRVWIETDSKESLDKKDCSSCANSLSSTDKVPHCEHSAHFFYGADNSREEEYLSTKLPTNYKEYNADLLHNCANISSCKLDNLCKGRHDSGHSVSSSESLDDMVTVPLREKCTVNLCLHKSAEQKPGNKHSEVAKYNLCSTTQEQDLETFLSESNTASTSSEIHCSAKERLCNSKEPVSDFQVCGTEHHHSDMFSKMKSKLKYSASFKTRRELQKISEKREGNSVLSSSWDKLETCESAKSSSPGSDLQLSADRILPFGNTKYLSDEKIYTAYKGSDDSHPKCIKDSDNTEEVFETVSECDCNANYPVGKEGFACVPEYKNVLEMVGTAGSDKVMEKVPSDSECQDYVPQLLEVPSKCVESAQALERELTSSQNVNSTEVEDDAVVNIPLPYGWKESFDEELYLPCYIHEESGEKWFSSNDAEGRVYFYQENSTASSWRLPEIPTITVEEAPVEVEHLKELHRDTDKPTVTISSDDSQIRHQHEPQSRPLFRMAKAQSMVLTDAKNKDNLSNSSSTRGMLPWWDGKHTLKEGTLHKTKMCETGGKKVRKNWAPSYVVLNKHQISFFKDQKTFLSMKGTSSALGVFGGPELCIDLEGAWVDEADKLSSRKYVFAITTVHGLRVLLQCEDKTLYTDWYQTIRNAIRSITEDSGLRNSASTKDVGSLLNRAISPDRTRKIPRIDRTRSVKSKNKEGSLEDLASSPEDQQIRIHTRLKNFFLRRPMKETLEQRGILKNEAVFGCHLPDLCSDAPYIPLFVLKCVEAIELKEENMKTIGLYRASGNLSQVQKIRLQVNQDNYRVLEEEEDVHVLTGALKLFFRELKEPVIPCHLFGRARDASNKHGEEEKVSEFREIVKVLPEPNRNTLKFLLQHLLRVTEYTADNQMTVHTLAIVFGPSLMWPEEESQNIAFDYMMQNVVIEYLLKAFQKIFDGL